MAPLSIQGMNCVVTSCQDHPFGSFQFPFGNILVFVFIVLPLSLSPSVCLNALRVSSFIIITWHIKVKVN